MHYFNFSLLKEVQNIRLEIQKTSFQNVGIKYNLTFTDVLQISRNKVTKYIFILERGELFISKRVGMRFTTNHLFEILNIPELDVQNYQSVM